jgi:hypothetical protein
MVRPELLEIREKRRSNMTSRNEVAIENLIYFITFLQTTYYNNTHIILQQKIELELEIVF